MERSLACFRKLCKTKKNLECLLFDGKNKAIVGDRKLLPLPNWQSLMLVHCLLFNLWNK